jgi:hypothetical protein
MLHVLDLSRKQLQTTCDRMFWSRIDDERLAGAIALIFTVPKLQQQQEINLWFDRLAGNRY